MDVSYVRDRLIDKTAEGVAIANGKLGMNRPPPSLDFSLRGKTGGLAYSHLWKIRYNVPMAVLNFENFLSIIPFHELAHLWADAYFGKRCHHGRGWKWVMTEVFGLAPDLYHCYDTTELRARKTFWHEYRCDCPKETVKVGTKHHNIIQRNEPHVRWVRCLMCRKMISPNDFLRSYERV